MCVGVRLCIQSNKIRYYLRASIVLCICEFLWKRLSQKQATVHTSVGRNLSIQINLSYGRSDLTCQFNVTMHFCFIRINLSLRCLDIPKYDVTNYLKPQKREYLSEYKAVCTIYTFVFKTLIRVLYLGIYTVIQW